MATKIKATSSTDAKLVEECQNRTHALCLKTLQDMLEKEISPTSLFMISRALEQEYEKENVVDIPLSEACFNPIKVMVTPPVPFHISKSFNCPTKIDILPLDLKWHLLSFLDSRSLLSYFNSSRDALALACELPSWRLLYSYTKSIEKTKVQDMVVFAYHTFKDVDYSALDALLLWVEGIDSLARHLKVKLPADLPTQSFVTSFPLGHRQLELDISATMSGLKVYLISIKGKHYISGIEGIPLTSCRLIGDRHNAFRNIDFRTEDINKLGFLLDSLGIRSLQLGEGIWSSGTPCQLDCFEGFSSRAGGTKKLVVLADALKFRRISWQNCLPDMALSLSETVIMKPQHIGLLLPEHYICRRNIDNAWSIDTFGVIATESIVFDDDIRGISMYFREGFDGLITGVCAHSKVQQFSGKTSGKEIFFPVQGGKERISTIAVWSDNIHLSLQVSTTLGRQHLFGPAEILNTAYICNILVPPVNQSLHGCCFQFGHYGLESIGIICRSEY